MKLKRIVFTFLLMIMTEALVSANTVLIFNNFNDGEVNHNALGGVSSFFKNGGADCKPFAENRLDYAYGRQGYSLRLDFDVRAADSFAGYWSQLEGFDLSGYNYLSFWIKGETGKEYMKVQIKIENSTNTNRAESSVYVDNYLPRGLSTSWQKVVIPLDAFYNINDWSKIQELVFVFENYQTGMNGGATKSSVYIDNIIFGSKFLGFLPVDSFNDNLTPCAPGGNVGVGGESGSTVTSSIVQDDYVSSPNSLNLSYSLTLGNYAYYFMVLGGGKDLWSKVDHNLSRYKLISFHARAESTNKNPKGIKVEVHHKIELDGQPFYKILTNASKHLETSWQQFKIDLTNFKDFSLNDLNMTQINEVVFTFEEGNAIVNSGSVYIDDILFEASGYTNNPAPPITPSGLKDNGVSLQDEYTFTFNSKLSVNAGSSLTDPLLECIRWEYSFDNVNWHIFQTDYNTSDTSYESIPNLDNFSEKDIYFLRVVAQDIYGIESVLGPYKSIKFSKTGYSEERPGKLMYKFSVDNNPFSPNSDGTADAANFSYTLTKTANVTVKVFDIKGDLLWEKTMNNQAAGIQNSIVWDGKDKNQTLVRNGVYLYKISASASDEDDHIIQVIGVIK
ncbi:MAG: gliding motility-associated C-terminal domain-containing protein [Spirochaetes bacterium]|nr:gliding motility-associated C-terminal domain-containing protein [Spirochaetota bacterium]